MEEEEFVSWYRAIQADPEYYTNTEQGQKELADMIRKESERLLEEIGKSVRRTKEIIWLSRFCDKCQFFSQESKRMRCNKWAVRIVKPFHGSPIWTQAPSKTTVGEKELVVEEIDWDARWKEISDKIVERAVDLVNGGYPYYCYKGQ
ncbi:MAG TPA: hypothetical protein VEC02_00265 [Nitrososphaerales archaeon]|nr:hypothetical protein [Nitrososphaerales archaeon]